MRTTVRLLIPLATLSVAGLARAADGPPKPAVDFSRDVRPILSDKCFQCHGPNQDSREADLRLDRRDGARRVLTAGKNGSIELLRRITSKDADERMPPAKTKLPLSNAQIDTLRKWVRGGAPYQQHWAFKPVGKITVPKVKRSKWTRNAIDRFILARLEREGLSPSPTATREKLIRRVTFDLTGLPPTLKEIDAFLNAKAPDAYEKVVDRLLKSRAFGERMASEWLDVARYSDTYGYQVDRDRFVWPWRDWVIRAFNANMPYDRFVTLQLAGDLLPNASDEQVLATTFNRLHPQKVEGGSTPEEFRVEYVADRTQTFGTAFLGLTLECCRCHDHKYDPVSQKEYYQLFAYFNSIDEAGLYSYFTPSVPTPTLLLTDAATKKRVADAKQRVVNAETPLAALQTTRRTTFEAWVRNKTRASKTPAPLAYLDFERTAIGGNRRVPGRIGKAVRLTGDDAVGLKVGNFTRNQPFSVSLWMNTPDVKTRAVVFHRSRAWTDAGSRGYELLIEDGKLSAALIHFWPGNAIRVRTKKPIPVKRWLHVAVTYDGSSRAAGLRLFVDGKPAPLDVVRDHLFKNITGGGGNNIAIGARFRDFGFKNGLVDEFQVFNRQLTPLEIAQLHDGNSLTTALTTPAGKLIAAQRDALSAYYLTNFDADYRRQLAAVKRARDLRSKTVDGLREIMVMREMPKPRPSFLLTRGAYDKPAERVVPKTPAVFPPMPKGAPANRLGLAKWLTDPAHPLTARVAVNRYWQMIFGQGLVRTPEDFGSQGRPPTHPELLDWLARDFVTHKWNVKRLLKQMVMSATYRQTSAARSPASERDDQGRATKQSKPVSGRHQSRRSRASSRDPENRLLARGPSYQLPAEMLRDNALAVSGLLVRKIGGPPVKPYEVEASFKPSRRSKGESLYRRSLYTYWKRTAPAPAMMALDAAKRDVCRVKRERTSSPLQTFVMLNSPQIVEAARVLAQRLLKQHGDKTDAAIVDLFRLLTSRRPSAAEQKLLTTLFQQQLQDFTKNPTKAAAYLNTGDAKPDPKFPPAKLAALAVVANTVLNFDECTTKR
ncbi:MAG: DUF1553 domain-containing protein [Planctomycetaceae bacterium]